MDDYFLTKFTFYSEFYYFFQFFQFTSRDFKETLQNNFNAQRLELSSYKLHICGGVDSSIQTSDSNPKDPRKNGSRKSSGQTADVTFILGEEISEFEQKLYFGTSHSKIESITILKQKADHQKIENSNDLQTVKSSSVTSISDKTTVCRLNSSCGSIENFEKLENLIFIATRNEFVIFDEIKSSVINKLDTSDNPLIGVAVYDSFSKFALGHFDGTISYYDYEAKETQSEAQCDAYISIILSKRKNQWQDINCVQTSTLFKSIQKIQCYCDWLVYEGGVPKIDDIDHDDLHVLTMESVVSGVKMSVYLPSKILMFHIVSQELIIILTEQEIIGFDPKARVQVSPPYLQALHSSPITELKSFIIKSVTAHTGKSNTNSLDRRENRKPHDSKSKWSINGGQTQSEQTGNRTIDRLIKINSSSVSIEIIATGHANGMCNIYNSDKNHLQKMYTLETAQYFEQYDEPVKNRYDHVEGFNLTPIGIFDPFTDDERFQISRIDVTSDVIVAGCNGGHVFVFKKGQFSSKKVQYQKIDLFPVESRPENFQASQKCLVYNGNRTGSFSSKNSHNCPGNIKNGSGFQVTEILQLLPSSRLTSIEINTQNALVLLGTAFGFLLWDYRQNKIVLTHCTMNKQAAALASDYNVPFGRSMRSLNKSIRASLRSMRQSIRRRSNRKLESALPNHGTRNPRRDTNELKPWQGTLIRKIEQTGKNMANVNSVFSGVIRSVYFCQKANIRSNDFTDIAMLVGTHGGMVYIYGLSVPDYHKRGDDLVVSNYSVFNYLNWYFLFSLEKLSEFFKETKFPAQAKTFNALYAKCIQLQHKAPIVGVRITKHGGGKMDHVSSEKISNSKSTNSGQSLLTICTEEQIKTFTLPQLKSKKKLKITALEGTKIKNIQFIKEDVLTGVLNNGTVRVFKLNTSNGVIKGEFDFNVVTRDNLAAVNSMMVLPNGSLTYRSGTSQIERYRFNFRDLHTTSSMQQIEQTSGLRSKSLCKLISNVDYSVHSGSTVKDSAAGTECYGEKVFI